MLKNVHADTSQIAIETRDGHTSSETTTDLHWPEGVVSLSHLAVPIPPEDPIYGTKEATEPTGLSLGTLSVRTEPGALLINYALFSRCRHNPFYAFTENRIIAWLAKTVPRTPRQSGSN